MADNDKKISEFTSAVADDISDNTIIPAVTSNGGTLKNVKATLAQIRIDASTTRKGSIQLTGDLSGTASNPTVPGLLDKANLNSPVFTGEPLVPDIPVGDASNKAANTKFVSQAVQDALAGAGGSGAEEITETISSHIEIPQNKTYILETITPYSFKVVSISIQSNSGTGNFWLTSDGVPLQGGDKDASNYTGAFDNSVNTLNLDVTIASGANLVLEVAEVDQALDLTFTIAINRDI